MTGNRADALTRLDVFVGDWVLEARFPGGGDAPAARSTFEWALDRQFLIQRTEVPVPEAPDGLMIVSADPETGAYTQHYYDSRGVVRLYAMSLADGVWTLTRESPDFTPLDFRQRIERSAGGVVFLNGLFDRRHQLRLDAPAALLGHLEQFVTAGALED